MALSFPKFRLISTSWGKLPASGDFASLGTVDLNMIVATQGVLSMLVTPWVEPLSLDGEDQSLL
jgi:hypothetical protein